MKLVDSDAYFLTAVRYVLRNPLTAGRTKELTDWQWSSCRAMMGLEVPAGFLSFDPVWKALAAEDAATGRERLEEFLRTEDIGEGFREIENSVLSGGERLARAVDPLLPPSRRNRDFTYVERFATRPSLEDLFADAITQDEVDDVAREAFCHHAYTLRAIGDVLKHPPGTVWAWIQRSAKRASAGLPLGPRSPQRRRSQLSPPRRGQISIFE